MKRKLFATVVLFLVLVLVSSCNMSKKSNSKSEVDSNLPDPASFRQQDRADYFIETVDYYYCLFNNRVYFSQKDNLAFYILCNKPDCKHNDGGCNANSDYFLGYWNEHLYGVVLSGDEPYIFRMNLDGTEHKKIASLEMPVNSDGTAGGMFIFYIHEGYIYYSVSNVGMNSLFRVELSTGETKRLFEDMLHGATSLHPKFCFTNSKAYFLLRDNDVRTFYSIDIPTMELQEVRRWSTEILAWSVYDNTLYYYASERGTFCEYDLTTGAEKTFSQLDYFGGAAYYDDTYIYLITWNDDDGNGKGLSIFSRDYQLLERIEFSANQDLLYDAQDKLIFTTLPSQKATKYLPKSAIGTGEAELLPIEDPYSYR